MPVVIESINHPSAQDSRDLAKIYADAPAWLHPPYATAAALIEAGSRCGSLIAGRFNDRLHGAALLEQRDDCWRLSHLCVRQITRSRGVGQRLFDEAQRLAREAGKPLHLVGPGDRLECQALAARLDLTLESL
jgi:GNAT superfamily N-acetyltransferase